MTAPTYYAYDVNGVYTSSVVLRQSPLDPAGTWLVPARTTSVAPPTIPSGQEAVWSGSAWGLQPIGTTPAPPSPTFPQLQQEVLAAASAVSSSLVTAISPDAAHQQGFQNAAAVVAGNGGSAPTTGPYATQFAALASSYSMTPSAFATMVTALMNASWQNTNAGLAIQAAVAAATTSTQLASAITTFDTSIGQIVTAINAAVPVPIAAPAAIVIAGVNS